jgi:predicted solute-binding protein
MATLELLLDDTLTTAMLAYPFRAGWVAAEHAQLVTGLTARAVRAARSVALLDALAARTLLDTHVLVRDVGIASRRASFITLATHTRPDEVGAVTISTANVSPATLALAQIVVPDFYGIPVVGWTEQELELSATTAQVSEGARALIPFEHEEWYQEDLGRAWLLLTDSSFVSHVAVAPRAAIASDPRAVAEAVGRLIAARDAGRSRARELRRDISNAHTVDREVLTETLADQSYELGKDELHGLTTLWRRAGLPVSDKELRAALVTTRQLNPA